MLSEVMGMKTYYFDNAATSCPKAPGVADAMAAYINDVCATVNRGSYAPAQAAEGVALSLREKLGTLLGCGDPARVILTPGATYGLNQAILGYLRPGDKCVVGATEHNAVMRPLNALGCEILRLPGDPEGFTQVEALPEYLEQGAKMVVLGHGSNVSGAINDVKRAAEICASYSVPLVVDAAQTAGHIPVSLEGWGAAAVAVPGHKGLLGPQGIGALVLAPDFAKTLRPLTAGGTGSASHQEGQPPYLPDKFEPGTPNLPGIYGLEAALRYLETVPLGVRRAKEMDLSRRFLEGAAELPGIRLLGPKDPARRVAVFSLDFSDRDNAQAALELEQRFGILARCGLHCAPSAHKVLGSYPQGTVRFSFGPFTTEEDVEYLLSALKELCR